MDVRTAPLVTGQELVFELVYIGENFVVVKTPMVFQVVRHPQTGAQSMAFGEWPSLALADGSLVQIPINSLLCLPLKAHEEIERSYIGNVTGLALPPATPQIITG